MSAYQKKGFWIGILFFIGILALPTPADLSNTGWIVAAIATLMAIWWATEAIPVAVTALLPLALFPLFDLDQDQLQAHPRLEFWGHVSSRLLALSSVYIP